MVPFPDNAYIVPHSLQHFLLLLIWCTLLQGGHGLKEKARAHLAKHELKEKAQPHLAEHELKQMACAHLAAHGLLPQHSPQAASALGTAPNKPIQATAPRGTPPLPDQAADVHVIVPATDAENAALPAVQGNPADGDIVAYKLLEIGFDWTPQVRPHVNWANPSYPV